MQQPELPNPEKALEPASFRAPVRGGLCAVAKELGVGVIACRAVAMVDARAECSPDFFLMAPFLVRACRGPLPTQVLDRPEAPRAWASPDELASSPIRAIRKIAALSAGTEAA